MRIVTTSAAVIAVSACILPATASLVGHWTFDEGSGTSVADSSGQANHGTVVNAKPDTWTNGVSGGALYFDPCSGGLFQQHHQLFAQRRAHELVAALLPHQAAAMKCQHAAVLPGGSRQLTSLHENTPPFHG